MNRKVLIMVPHMPMIFNWVNADNLKLIRFFEDLSEVHNDFILKFHPRHSQIDEYKDLVNFPNFQLEQEENILELLNEADIVIAFETSSVLFEVIFMEKPIIYISDYIQLFENDEVYKSFLSNMNEHTFDEALKIIKKEEYLSTDRFLPKLKTEDIFYSVGEQSTLITLENLNKIIEKKI